jgi:hypothetical protein
MSALIVGCAAVVIVLYERKLNRACRSDGAPPHRPPPEGASIWFPLVRRASGVL